MFRRMGIPGYRIGVRYDGVSPRAATRGPGGGCRIGSRPDIDKSGIFICLCFVLSLSLDKIGVGSAKQILQATLLCSRLSLIL